MSKKVLVTGGTGYIGSHTTVELQHEGYEVLIIDNLSNSELTVLDGIEKISGRKPEFENFDLCDLGRLRQFFIENPGIDSIIHFAALKAVGESVAKPLLYYHNNLSSLMNLLACMEEFSISSLVFSSSCTVYGQPRVLPVTESAPVQTAISPYGNTKQIGEEIIRDSVASSKKIKAISLRYFNPIGAHSSNLIGELPIGTPENLVPFITQTAAGLREELSVFGDDYNTPDGSCIRDYLHVVDLAKAHVIALERMLTSGNKEQYEVFNLGTGLGVSVFEAISSFEKVSGTKLNYRVIGRREGDIEKIWADPALANRELGWQVAHSLDDAMLSAWEWEMKCRGIEH